MVPDVENNHAVELLPTIAAYYRLLLDYFQTATGYYRLLPATTSTTTGWSSTKALIIDSDTEKQALRTSDHMCTEYPLSFRYLKLRRGQNLGWGRGDSRQGHVLALDLSTMPCTSMI